MIAKIIIALFIIIPLIFLLPRLATGWYARSRLYDADKAPHKPAAIVFGAGLWRNGQPTPVLRDRVQVAADLFFAGKVEKLIMSGDNRFVEYNEPGAMRDYALDLGVPDTAIVLDYAGQRTYDTCYRARKIFGVKEAILVTQSFHLPRALYTCNMLGIPSVGVASDLQVYQRRAWFYWSLREIPATLVAVWEVNVSHPLPVLGKPEPIFQKEVQ
jgi:SanA protein